MAMMAMTTRSSISVKPFSDFDWHFIPLTDQEPSLCEPEPVKLLARRDWIGHAILTVNYAGPRRNRIPGCRWPKISRGFQGKTRNIRLPGQQNVLTKLFNVQRQAADGHALDIEIG